MGTGPEAVVDPQLRVRGVDGLRVMDASVLPTMVAGNTNAPLIAMSVLAARRAHYGLSASTYRARFTHKTVRLRG